MAQTTREALQKGSFVRCEKPWKTGRDSRLSLRANELLRVVHDEGLAWIFAERSDESACGWIPFSNVAPTSAPSPLPRPRVTRRESLSKSLSEFSDADADVAPREADADADAAGELSVIAAEKYPSRRNVGFGIGFGIGTSKSGGRGGPSAAAAAAEPSAVVDIERSLSDIECSASASSSFSLPSTAPSTLPRRRTSRSSKPPAASLLLGDAAGTSRSSRSSLCHVAEKFSTLSPRKPKHKRPSIHHLRSLSLYLPPLRIFGASASSSPSSSSSVSSSPSAPCDSPSVTHSRRARGSSHSLASAPSSPFAHQQSTPASNFPPSERWKSKPGALEVAAAAAADSTPRSGEYECERERESLASRLKRRLHPSATLVSCVTGKLDKQGYALTADRDDTLICHNYDPEAPYSLCMSGDGKQQDWVQTFHIEEVKSRADVVDHNTAAPHDQAQHLAPFELVSTEVGASIMDHLSVRDVVKLSRVSWLVRQFCRTSLRRARDIAWPMYFSHRLTRAEKSHRLTPHRVESLLRACPHAERLVIDDSTFSGSGQRSYDFDMASHEAKLKLDASGLGRSFPMPLSCIQQALKRAQAPFPRLQELILDVDSQFFTSLRALPHLKTLHLRCHRLNRPLELAPVSHACPKLESLVLHDCRQFDVASGGGGNGGGNGGTRKFAHLRKFEVRKASRFVPPQLVGQLSRLLELLPKALEGLTLVGFRVPEGCVDYICENFKELKLCCINSAFDSNIEIKTLRSLPSLTHAASICSNPGSHKVFSQFPDVQCFPNLKGLCLCACKETAVEAHKRCANVVAMTILEDVACTMDRCDDEIFRFTNLQYLKLSGHRPSWRHMGRFGAFSSLEQLVLQNRTLNEATLFALLRALARTQISSLNAQTRFPTSERVLRALTTLSLKFLGLSFACLPFPTGHLSSYRERRRCAKFSRMCARFSSHVSASGFPKSYVLKRSDAPRPDYVPGGQYFVNGVEHVRRPYKKNSDAQNVPVFT